LRKKTHEAASYYVFWLAVAGMQQMSHNFLNWYRWEAFNAVENGTISLKSVELNLSSLLGNGVAVVSA
jgi:hypothetical protein